MTLEVKDRYGHVFKVGDNIILAHKIRITCHISKGVIVEISEYKYKVILKDTLSSKKSITLWKIDSPEQIFKLEDNG